MAAAVESDWDRLLRGHLPISRLRKLKSYIPNQSTDKVQRLLLLTKVNQPPPLDRSVPAIPSSALRREVNNSLHQIQVVDYSCGKRSALPDRHPPRQNLSLAPVPSRSVP